MDDKIKNEINEYILMATDAEIFIKFFNQIVEEYGRISFADAMYLLKMIFYVHSDIRYVDMCYGWTRKITLEKDFIVDVKGNTINCRFNLPKPEYLNMNEVC